MLSAVFFSAKGPFHSTSLLSLWFGRRQTIELFQMLLPTALPCVFGESPLAKGTTGLRKGVKINVHTTGLSLAEDEQKEAVTMIPTSSGEQMSGRTGARRSSVQPQPRPSKVPWSLPFFLVRCFLRMIRRLGLWSLLSSNAAAVL